MQQIHKILQIIWAFNTLKRQKEASGSLPLSEYVQKACFLLASNDLASKSDAELQKLMADAIAAVKTAE